MFKYLTNTYTKNERVTAFDCFRLLETLKFINYLSTCGLSKCSLDVLFLSLVRHDGWKEVERHCMVEIHSLYCLLTWCCVGIGIVT